MNDPVFNSNFYSTPFLVAWLPYSMGNASGQSHVIRLTIWLKILEWVAGDYTALPGYLIIILWSVVLDQLWVCNSWVFGGMVFQLPIHNRVLWECIGWNREFLLSLSFNIVSYAGNNLNQTVALDVRLGKWVRTALWYGMVWYGNNSTIFEAQTWDFAWKFIFTID